MLAKRGEMEKFEKFSNFLFMKSNSFLLLFIHRTIPRWHSDVSISEIMKIIDEVREIHINNSKGLEIKRVMIPKKDGTLRPLSVPTKA